MGILKAEIALGLLALTCGQVLFWRRRDNVLGYVQGGIFLTTLLLPLYGTDFVERFDDDLVQVYANLLLLGGFSFLAGMCLGAPLGSTKRSNERLTFAQPFPSAKLVQLITARARMLAVVGVLSLSAGFLLLGYAPLLAKNPAAAKYGIGPYAEGFERGVLVYRFGLAMASVSLPVILAVFWRKRRLLDLGLSIALTFELLLSLSRALAFSGILLVVVAVCIERRVRALFIMSMVALVYIIGALSNELLLPTPDNPGSIAKRVAISTPDILDHLSFMRGFQIRGEQTSGWALIAAGLSVKKGYYDPSTYALRTVNGEANLENIPSGGLRLPAPLWGYVSFGYAGAAAWAFLAGFFTGWGTVRLRRLVTQTSDKEGASLNLTLAAVYYAGTFGVLSSFYFASSAMLLQFALALYLGRIFGAPERFDPQIVQAPPRLARLPVTQSKISSLNR